MLKLNYDKRKGIDPEKFEEIDILTSINEGNSVKDMKHVHSDSEEIEVQVNKPLMEMIWISRKSKFYIIEQFLYVLSCLISSYMYAWISVFGR